MTYTAGLALRMFMVGALVGVFTFNLRDLTDLGRFSMVLTQVAGRRLTYAELIRG